MEQIKWIRAITCKECALEFKKIHTKEIESLIKERSRRQKCIGCHRLNNCSNGNEENNI